MEKIFSKKAQRTWFRYFLSLPDMILVATILFFLVFGIVDANNAHMDYDTMTRIYGLFGFEHGFFVSVLWFVIGVVVSVITWAFFKMIFSPIALLVLNTDKSFLEIDIESDQPDAPYKNE